MIRANQTSLETIPAEEGHGEIRTSRPVAAYLLNLCNPRSRRTMHSTLQSLARALGIPDIGQIDWASLRYEHVPQIKDAINRMDWSLSMKKRCLVALRQVAREAWLLKMISFEVYEGIRAQKTFRGSELPRGRYVDYSQTVALYRATDQTLVGLRDRAMLALLFGCGLRRSEAATVTLEGIDGRELRVMGKGRKERIVPFSESADHHLQAWIQGAELEGGAVLRKFSLGNRTRGWKRRPAVGNLSGESIRARMAKLSTAAQIPATRPHDARRTYATNLIQAGVDLHVVAELLGHAGVATLAPYDMSVRRRCASAAEMITLPVISPDGSER